MFDHVALRASDLAASKRFYGAVLAELGIAPTRVGRGRVEWQDFHLLAAEADRRPTRHLHIAFVAPTRAHVDAFWHAALAVGGASDGEPGERGYTPGYYGAFVLDPDGNSAEAVIHSDVRRGGHIDHLWIGVAELARANDFYATIARHTGLREGRRWEQGRQFRGAWATFSLVADGRPPTENLKLAFPAPDRRTVEELHALATGAGYGELVPPAERDAGVWSACVLDPDGTAVASVARAPG